MDTEPPINSSLDQNLKLNVEQWLNVSLPYDTKTQSQPTKRQRSYLACKCMLHVLYYGTGNDVIVMHDVVHCTAIASSEKGGISRLILNIE